MNLLTVSQIRYAKHPFGGLNGYSLSTNQKKNQNLLIDCKLASDAAFSKVHVAFSYLLT